MLQYLQYPFKNTASVNLSKFDFKKSQKNFTPLPSNSTNAPALGGMNK